MIPAGEMGQDQLLHVGGGSQTRRVSRGQVTKFARQRQLILAVGRFDDQGIGLVRNVFQARCLADVVDENQLDAVDNWP